MLANAAVANLSGVNTGNQTITLTGDVTGTGTSSFVATLKNTGTAGTYSSVTTDAQGRVTSGSNTTALSQGKVDSYTLVTSSTTAGQILASLSATTFRTVKALIQVVSGTSYHATELLVIHDDTTASIMETGFIFTDVSLASFDVVITGGNIQIVTTPTNAASTYKAVITAINA
jgi:hypothetical protein